MLGHIAYVGAVQDMPVRRLRSFIVNVKLRANIIESTREERVAGSGEMEGRCDCAFTKKSNQGRRTSTDIDVTVNEDS